MRIRTATVADAVELAELRWEWRIEEEPEREARESRGSFVERFVDSVTSDVIEGRWTVWVAEDDDRIVSNVWVYRVPKVPNPGSASRDFGYVTNVYTKPGVRNLGIGTELMEAVKSWAHGLDLEMLIVWPSDPSLPWYRRAGFERSPEMLELEIAGYAG
ncbi:MAG TPA: GNAT family N-acetyltransferase [Acidimicrobiales bacterium]|nr:GNAT family N-acetyltransferase [Acidimicrobiales bacterium]